MPGPLAPVRGDTMAAARIVILNGIGSAGKSSIARALQTITAEPYLHLSMDAFLDMLPPALLDHPDGLRFETLMQDGRPAVAIHSGPVIGRLLHGMRQCVAAMARAGNNLIVDEVIIDEATPGAAQAEYERLLAPLRPVWVGVMASLAVLEDRESRRADRMPGLARWQFGRVHAGMRYDFTVDTDAATAEACALAIRQQFEL
jgi:chloramphenicol 3-O phosphotransferase